MGKSTVTTEMINGIPITIYNSIIGNRDCKVKFDDKIYDGFYVSYNNYDINIYGDVTTALVLGQMEKFFILNGNHTEEYKKLIDCGFAECLEYFNSHTEQVNKFSDR